MSLPLVGIIANPASGRDIRRLVAHGTVFDNNEKTAIVRRVLVGLEAVGIRRIAYMPEHDFGILPRALTELRGMGAGCIITLGGDGTNRAVARGCGAVPLIPISTGTNNVFPTFLEGTIAGMAAGLAACDMRDGKTVVRQAPRLEVCIEGVTVESALVDVVVSSLPFVGARALWETSVVREVVLARVIPGAIGFSALGGALLDTGNERNERAGMHIVVGADGSQVMVPLAPGLVTWVGVTEHRWLAINDVVRFQPGAGTLALDGEREIELSTTSRVEVQLCADGPYVVDVPATLEGAALAGRLRRQQVE